MPQDQIQQIKLVAGFGGARPSVSPIIERRLGGSVTGYEERVNNLSEKARMSVPLIGRNENQMYYSTASPERFNGTNKGQKEDSDHLVTKVKDQEKQIV